MRQHSFLISISSSTLIVLVVSFFVFIPSAEAKCCVVQMWNTQDNPGRYSVSCSDEKDYSLGELIPFEDQCTGEGKEMISELPRSSVQVSPFSCIEVPECPGGSRQPSHPPLTLINPFQFNFTEDLKNGLPYGLGRIASWLLGFTGVLAFLMFVWGGFQWLTSSGQVEKIEKGVATMKWAAIGVLLAFGSFALLTYFLNEFRTQVNPSKQSTNTSKKK